MAKSNSETDWTAVIGKCLAFLCLEQIKKLDPKKVDSVPKKVDFLIDMGLPSEAAAYVAGSSPASVAELRRRAKTGGTKSGKKAR